MIRLESEHMIFRDHEPGDLEPYCAIESDATYRWPQPVHPRSELERSFNTSWLMPKTMGLYATIYKPDGNYIGRCGLYPLRDDSNKMVEREAVMAYYLARAYWGRGLATEAGHAFIVYGFTHLGLRRIEAGINADNKASMRVIEKLGFQWVKSGIGGGNQWHQFELINPFV